MEVTRPEERVVLFNAVAGNPAITAALSNFRPHDLNQQANVVSDLENSESRLSTQLSAAENTSTGRQLLAVNRKNQSMLCFWSSLNICEQGAEELQKVPESLWPFA